MVNQIDKVYPLKVYNLMNQYLKSKALLPLGGCRKTNILIFMSHICAHSSLTLPIEFLF